MSVTTGEGVEPVTLAGLQTLARGLVTQDRSSCTDAELLADWRTLEAVRNTLAAVEHPILLEVERRGIADARAAANLPSFTRDLLRITANEAGARIRAAHCLGPRQTLTGEPQFPLVAAA